MKRQPRRLSLRQLDNFVCDIIAFFIFLVLFFSLVYMVVI